MSEREVTGDWSSFAPATDPERCVVCGEPLDANTEPWQRGLDGGGAHLRCLDITEQGDQP